MKKLYTNVIKEEYNEDICDERDIQFNIYEDIEKKVTINYRINECACRIAVWLKYYGLENVNYKNMIEPILDPLPYILSNKEIDEVCEKVEMILKNEYGILIISKNPLILGSEKPLNEIKIKIYEN